MRVGILCLFMLFASNAVAADYLLFEENGKYGVKNQEGKVIINAAFEGLGWSDGSFSVIGQVTGYKSNNRWGLINLRAERLTPAAFLSLLPSGGDRFVVKKEIDAIHTKVGCIDLKGATTIPLKFDGIKIVGLRAIVFVKEGVHFNYGVTNLNGDIIIPLRYRNILAIGDMRFAVQNDNDKYSLFSETGNQLIDFSIDSISNFNKNKAIIHEGFQKGIINRDGIIEVQPMYREIVFDTEGKAKAKLLDKWMILDGNNQVDLTTSCDELIPTSAGYIVKIDNHYGLWDAKFKSIVPVVYSKIETAKNELIVAKRNNKYGLINTGNTVIIPFRYDSISLHDRFVRVKERALGKDAWQLFDIYGIRKSDRSYEFIDSYNGQFSMVKNYGLYGVVDRYGKEIIPCLYDSILAYNEDQMAVKFHGHYGIIDFRENWLVPPQPFPLRLVDDQHFLLKDNDTWHFKTFIGDLIYFTDNSLTADRARRTLREILPDGTEKEISFEGITLKRTSPPIVENAEIVSQEHEGFRGIKRNGKYGFIDTDGRLRIANRYEGIGDFHQGLAAVRILGKWGFVNGQDKIVINPSYDWVSPFIDNLAVVKKGKIGLVDKVGNVVLDTRYDSIQKLATGNFLLYNNQLLGLASMNGEVLIDPRFDAVTDLGNGQVIVARDKKFGLLTEKGLSLIPMIYDDLLFLKATNQFLAKKESPWIQLPAK